MTWGPSDRDTDSSNDDLCVVTLYRITRDDEVTAADGSQIRIDVGEEIQGIIWDNQGLMHKFSVEVQSALAITSNLLLSFSLLTLGSTL